MQAVALTFDDGPGEGSARLLERLAQSGTPATFFLVGNKIGGQRELVARMAREGHELGSHSWAHGRLGERPVRDLVDLLRSSHAIRSAAGVSPRWFRPPYAGWTPRLIRGARLAGMGTVTWDVDPRDWESDDPRSVIQDVVSSAGPGSIVVLHDRPDGIAADALPGIVAGLRDRGLALATVSGLLARS